MVTTRLAALAGHFGRDIDRALLKLQALIESATNDGVDLLVLPDACLGGYISDLRRPDTEDSRPRSPRTARSWGPSRRWRAA